MATYQIDVLHGPGDVMNIDRFTFDHPITLFASDLEQQFNDQLRSAGVKRRFRAKTQCMGAGTDQVVTGTVTFGAASEATCVLLIRQYKS